MAGPEWKAEKGALLDRMAEKTGPLDSEDAMTRVAARGKTSTDGTEQDAEAGGELDARDEARKRSQRNSAERPRGHVAGGSPPRDSPFG